MVTGATFQKPSLSSKHATEKLLSCQYVCQCIPCQPQHLVPECHVLATKHNSSGFLSGCHFTKPGRLLKITSICEKTNERKGGWCKTSLPSSALPTRAAFSFECEDKSREDISVPHLTGFLY